MTKELDAIIGMDVPLLRRVRDGAFRDYATRSIPAFMRPESAGLIQQFANYRPSAQLTIASYRAVTTSAGRVFLMYADAIKKHGGGA